MRQRLNSIASMKSEISKEDEQLATDRPNNPINQARIMTDEDN